VGRAPSQRNLLVDALKFFAIALVPAQHLLSLRSEFMHLPGASWLVAVMLSFDMPLFTFLSGYVLPGREGTNPLRFLRTKALILLVPYVMWVALVMPLRHVPLSGWIPRLGSALVDPHRGFQMWYLWVLFALFVVFTLARLVGRSDVWTGGFALGMGALLVLPLPQTLGIDKIAWLYPFLILGYLCGKHRARLRRFDKWFALGGTTVFVVLTALRPGGVPALFAVGVGGIAASWAVFRLQPPALIRAQAWVGQKTLGIYGAQMLVLPYVMVGSGWPGAILSEITVMTTATLIAWALGLNTVTRALFLGQWPRKAAVPAVPQAPTERES
jgi:fucose 4-O-acetylase-like acetyltransferase